AEESKLAMSEIIVALATTAEKTEALEALIAQELAAFNTSDQAQDIVVPCSFQAEDMIGLDIVRQHLPNVPVVFLDTGYHFAEVYEYRDRMARDWSLNLINLLPEIPVPDREPR